MNKQERQVIKLELRREDETIAALERQYRKALRDIDDRIRIMQADELSQSRVYRIEYQKALRGQVAGILDKLHGDEYKTIQQYLHDSYQDGFIGTMYSIHGQGIPLIAPLDEDAAVKAIITDSKISEGLYNSLGVDTKELKKAISSEITRGIATNQPFADIVRNISNRSRAPLNRAKTIVRTESHRIQQAAANDARDAAKARGCDVVKQWDSTLDGNTRPTHKQLDGQIVETDKPFVVSKTKKAMYPGDFGSASEDCNCRCVALTRAKWALDEDELAQLKERARTFGLTEEDSKTYGHAKAKDFAEFKKRYLKASETLKNQGKSGIMEMADNGTSAIRVSEDVPAMAEQANALLDGYGLRDSKWSGNVVVKQPAEMPGVLGRKEWSCDITLRADAGFKTAVHEQLHARSVSHYNPQVYMRWQKAEEGAVEMFAQEICKRNAIPYREAYVPIVKQLRIANSIMKEYQSDYEFAEAFFAVDLPKRYSWLRQKADDVIKSGKLSQKSIKALNNAVETIH